MRTIQELKALESELSKLTGFISEHRISSIPPTNGVRYG